MEPEARRVWDMKLEKGIDMRTAAYVHALDRIAAAVTAHGGKAYFCS
jgi:glutamate dehydrogenase (NADP+)